MKAVMISIRPEWCEKIASGKKTIEVRMTKPKLETPFKCYIYCTLAGSNELFKNTLNGDVALWNRGKWADKKGYVIGEFICDSVLRHCEMANADLAEQMGCMKREKILEYSGGKEVFGWHISELKIYDKPKDISEFYKCGALAMEVLDDEFALNRPPQSWRYVKENTDE